jgi:two-component sensor histidine kinase
LREIVDAARCSLAQPKGMDILFSFDAEALVTAEQAVAIGAIASEALINSIKYSHPGDQAGAVNIGCRRTRCNGLVVEIKGAGGGRPREFQAKGSQYRGTGTDLMRTLARSLNANLEIIDGDPGRLIRLELPLPNQPTQ